VTSAGSLREPSRKGRKSLADRHRYDTQIEFVYQVRFEKGSRQLAPAHQPDIFAGARADFTDHRGGSLT